MGKKSVSKTSDVLVATGRCPECKSDVEILHGSSVSDYIEDYLCIKCLWSAPKCGDTACDGYMTGRPSTEGYYYWRCLKCGWTGEGKPFKPRGKVVVIEADSVKEAKEQIRTQVLKGCHLLSEIVTSDGKPNTIIAVGKTTKIAFNKAQRKIPVKAQVIEKKEIITPCRRTVVVEAFDEQKARTQARSQLSEAETMNTIRLIASGKKGVLGFGKKPGHYEAEISRQAVVEVTYKEKARVSAKIGKAITINSGN